MFGFKNENKVIIKRRKLTDKINGVRRIGKDLPKKKKKKKKRGPAKGFGHGTMLLSI